MRPHNCIVSQLQQYFVVKYYAEVSKDQVVVTRQEDDTNNSQCKAPVIQPVGRRQRRRPQNRWEDDIPNWYKEIWIPMTEVNNWVNDIMSDCISSRR